MYVHGPTFCASVSAASWAAVREFARLAADSPREIQRAVGTINRAAKTETKRAAVGVYNIKQARVEKDLNVKPGNLKVTIEGDPRPINMASYNGTRRLNKGLRIQPVRGGKVGVLRKGFIAKTKGFAAQRVGDKRLPIESVAGPSVADMLLNPKVADPLAEKLLGRAETELTRRLARLKGT